MPSFVARGVNDMSRVLFINKDPAFFVSVCRQKLAERLTDYRYVSLGMTHRVNVRKKFASGEKITLCQAKYPPRDN